MRAGKLRHWVTIQQLPSGKSGQTSAGDPSSAWTEVISAWAAIDPLSGREIREAAAAVQNVGTHLITMRYHAGITAKMRVLFGSRVFNIVSPPRNHEERGRRMEFDVQEGLLK